MTGHQVVQTLAEASAHGGEGGCDLSCGAEYGSLMEALQRGLISEADLDRSVKRLMAARFRLGMFDPPGQVPYTSIPITAKRHTRARQPCLCIARQSIVLLKNSEYALPLRRSLRHVAVIGPTPMM